VDAPSRVRKSLTLTLTLTLTGGRAFQSPEELVIDTRTKLKEACDEVGCLLELLNVHMAKTASDTFAAELRDLSNSRKHLPYPDEEREAAMADTTTGQLIAMAQLAEVQSAEAREAHGLLRAVLADAAVSQRLVEDHMIVTATMVQLKGRNGTLEDEISGLRAEMKENHARAEKDSAVYEDLLAAAQVAHQALRDKVHELKGELKACSRQGVRSPIVTDSYHQNGHQNPAFEAHIEHLNPMHRGVGSTERSASRSASPLSMERAVERTSISHVPQAWTNSPPEDRSKGSNLTYAQQRKIQDANHPPQSYQNSQDYTPVRSSPHAVRASPIVSKGLEPIMSKAWPQDSTSRPNMAASAPTTGGGGKFTGQVPGWTPTSKVDVQREMRRKRIADRQQQWLLQADAAMGGR